MAPGTMASPRATLDTLTPMLACGSSWNECPRRALFAPWGAREPGETAEPAGPRSRVIGRFMDNPLHHRRLSPRDNPACEPLPAGVPLFLGRTGSRAHGFSGARVLGRTGSRARGRPTPRACYSLAYFRPVATLGGTRRNQTAASGGSVRFRENGRPWLPTGVASTPP